MKNVISKPTYKQSVVFYLIRVGLILLLVIGLFSFYVIRRDKENNINRVQALLDDIYAETAGYIEEDFLNNLPRYKSNKLRFELLNLWENYGICANIVVDDYVIDPGYCAVLSGSSKTNEFSFIMEDYDYPKLNAAWDKISELGFNPEDSVIYIYEARVNWERRFFIPVSGYFADPKTGEVLAEFDLLPEVPSKMPYQSKITVEKYSYNEPLSLRMMGNPNCMYERRHLLQGDPVVLFPDCSYHENGDYCRVSPDSPCVHQLYREETILGNYVTRDSQDWRTEIHSYVYLGMNVNLDEYNRLAVISTAKTITKFSLASLGIYLIIAFVLAYFRYYREKSIYSIFEYRRKMTDAMAHDLKTPLAITSVYVENLREDVDPTKRNEYLDAISGSVSHMNHLINDILEFSNSQFGNRRLEKVSIDLREDIDLIVNELKPRLDSGNLTVSVTGDAKLVVDKALWKQALINIFDNAIKYASKGSEIKVDISSRCMTVENSTDAEIPDVNKLKEPFVKGKAFRGEQQGSGLGLAVVENNMNLMGYGLELELQGKTFIVKLLFE